MLLALATVPDLIAGVGPTGWSSGPRPGDLSLLQMRMQQLIINGSAVPADSPYFAMFALPTKASDSDRWLGCGASVIHHSYALSSAHCFGGGKAPCSGPSDLALWVGDVQMNAQDEVGARLGGGKAHRVKAKLVCHPEFDGKCSHGNDVAILQLLEPLPSWVKPVKLDLDGSLATGGKLVTMGFGLVEQANNPQVISPLNALQLRQADVTVLADNAANCGRVYKGGYGCSDEFSEGKAKNINMQFCAGTAQGQSPRDTCSGDSGSPVVDTSGVQVGIVSYGGGPGHKMSGPGRICSDPSWPGIYARVSAFSSYLRKIIPDL